LSYGPGQIISIWLILCAACAGGSAGNIFAASTFPERWFYFFG